ncbi:hypothetical protein C5E10_12225 [Pseudoclavibacter sp. RFBG4]|uniref:hypothetical protein n=1 Tax=Pseudoclavibacter sp. RFBG4 TaxID=2080575 RepID=UPI000CE90381|nr:hypothetical protein [Pseudoclavibacter sp. RFBG4]PPG30884.1 hypothetical protein C5E10_12225 [Pseudoclavibacter sp. RFBG4]
MSDDTRAPRQPFDDGPQPEAGGGTGELRELPDAQDQLEAALARSRGIGEDGDVRSGDVLAGDDLAFDGRAEAPTDPALAPQDDVAVAFSDPLAADGSPAAEAPDPNATVGLDREELAAVLGHQPDRDATEPPAAEFHAVPEQSDHVDVAVPSQDLDHDISESSEAADPGEARLDGSEDLVDSYDSVPVVDRVGAEEDDAADFPVTEPVPAQELAADAIGAESVAAITVDAAGSATAPDDELDAPRRTLEIDRTAARVAAVSAAAPVAAAALDGERAVETDAGDAAQAEVVVTETVTEQLADDGETVEAVTVTERVDVLEGPSVTDAAVPAVAAESPGGPAESAGASEAEVSSVHAEDDATRPSEHLPDDERDDQDDERPAGAVATSSSTDDATFAPLRLSAPTDSDDLAPVKPKKRGNRMFAVFVALVAAVVFAALYLLAFALLRTAFNAGLDPIGEASEFAITAAFTVPVTVFAAFGVIWALIVNRAGWWAYVLGGFLAAALVVLGYYFGAALQQHLADGLPLASIRIDEVIAKFGASEHLLTALVAAIAAREAFTWVGGIAAARGRRVSRANRRAKLSYEKRMAERAAETAEANGSAE